MSGSRPNRPRWGREEAGVTQLAADLHPLLSGHRSPVESGISEPAFLAELRRSATARFEESGLPTRKLEEWRFTGVTHLAETDYLPPEPTAAAPAFVPLADAHRLVFVDGLLRQELSDINGLPTGVQLEGMSDALARAPETLSEELGSRSGLADHPFAALNTARFRDGAVLRIPAGVVVDRPIQLAFLGGDMDRPTLSAPRILIVAGRASQATVVESHLSDAGHSLHCAVSEIVLDDGAVVDHYRIVEEGPETTHIAAIDVSLGRDSAYRCHGFTLGGGLVRNDIFATLTGEGADAILNGLYLTGGRQHVDNHLRVRHQAPHCTSHQLYKGVLNDRSRAVFNGRIIVDPGAQKTDAKQSNRNLLLSETALAHSNPQLEIFADDVRCTHGSTVGRLDEDAVFYLRSRGIDRTTAESLLTFAFASEVVDGVRLEPIRDELRAVLLDRLPGSDLIREAL